jgi:hypothetical protein
MEETSSNSHPGNTLLFYLFGNTLSSPGFAELRFAAKDAHPDASKGEKC